MPIEALYLFAAVFAVLTLASITGRLIARRRLARDGVVGPGVENLIARVRAWWVMVLVLGLACLMGPIGVTLLFAFCSLTALREFLTLTHTRSGDHVALIAAFFIVLPGQYWLVHTGWYGLSSIFIPVYAFLFLPVFSALRGDTTRYLERIAFVQWGLMTCVYCIAHIPELLTLQIPGFEGRQILLLAFLLIIAEASDVMQYIFGKLFGRRKLVPLLSPGKTVEGFLYGISSVTLLGMALHMLTPFTPLQAGGMAFVICLAGAFGGFVMSAIKRDRGVKDWGTLIPGHGGMLDRIDSLVFAAPLFFHMIRYWFVP